MRIVFNARAFLIGIVIVAVLALLGIGFGVSPAIAVVIALLAVLLNGLILVGRGSRNVDGSDETKKDVRTN